MAEEADKSQKGGWKAAILALLLLAAGGGLTWWILNSGPEQQKVERKKQAPAVDVQPLESLDRPVSIEAFGEVRAAREVTLSPEVDGRVIEIHPELEPGAILREGELLLKIDPALYRVDVRRAKAALDTAQAALALEEGRSTVAQREYDLFKNTSVAPGDAAPEDDLGTAPLALREPQMKQAEARIDAARAELSEARILLERTTISVPFDAFVQEENLEVGRRVNPSSDVATLVGVDEFWAVVSMPVDQAERLRDVKEGATVSVSMTTRLGERVERDASFVRRLPDVNEEGRMARALISIKDPLSLAGTAPRLSLGSFVRAEIDAGILEGVYVIPREAVRENDQVWVRDSKGKLRFRDITVMWRREDVVYVRAEFKPDEKLVTSYLADPLPGIDVRVRGEQ